MARYNTVSPNATVTSGATPIATPAIGQFTAFTGAGGFTITIPDPAMYPGVTQSFYNGTSGVVTLSTGTTATFKGAAASGLTTQSIPANASFTLGSDGTNYALLGAIGGPITASDATFSGTLTANGALTANPANFNISLAPTGSGTVTINPAGASAMNNVAIGGTTRAAGAFTTLGANSTTTLTGVITANTTTNSQSFTTTGAGTITITSGTVGTIDNMTIGGSTRAVGNFTSLNANNQVTFSGGIASGATNTGTIVVTGGVGVSGQLTAATIVETSSIAFKENVEPITGALDSVLQLLGVTYDRKDGSRKHEIGLIAEDVYKIVPDLVTLDENGKPYGIQYTKLGAYLVECIKSLKDEINELKGSK
jgi:hypothetical protein